MTKHHTKNLLDQRSSIFFEFVAFLTSAGGSWIGYGHREKSNGNADEIVR
jgi:hypothetical protein